MGVSSSFLQQQHSSNQANAAGLFKGKKIKEEGVYLFGGKTGTGEITNKLKIIKLGMKPLKIITANTIGTKPFPRFGHSMNYFEEQNIILIYGGKNDKLIGKNMIFGDMFALNLENLNWSEVKLHGIRDQNLLAKAFHSCCLVDSKMIIFGGITENGYVNTSLYIIELDDIKARKLIKGNINFS